MKIYRLSQSNTIGPVYHGSPYQFNIEDMVGNIKFFTDNINFASEYGHQKSQERQMDADIKVLSAYIEGKLFDPQNPQHVESVLSYLPEKIIVYNNFGMSAELTKEKWKDFIGGVYTEPPLFSEEDLRGKSIGDYLVDNEVYSKPMKYELLKITSDMVWFANIGELDSIINGIYSFRWDREKIQEMHYSKQEVANDILNMDRISFMRKYHDVERKHNIHVMTASRKPKTTYNNDVWRWLEGEGVFEAIQEAGFNIVKSREKGYNTYAVFSTAKIIPIKN